MQWVRRSELKAELHALAAPLQQSSAVSAIPFLERHTWQPSCRSQVRCQTDAPVQYSRRCSCRASEGDPAGTRHALQQ